MVWVRWRMLRGQAARPVPALQRLTCRGWQSWVCLLIGEPPGAATRTPPPVKGAHVWAQIGRCRGCRRRRAGGGDRRACWHTARCYQPRCPHSAVHCWRLLLCTGASSWRKLCTADRQEKMVAETRFWMNLGQSRCCTRTARSRQVVFSFFLRAHHAASSLSACCLLWQQPSVRLISPFCRITQSFSRARPRPHSDSKSSLSFL